MTSHTSTPSRSRRIAGDRDDRLCRYRRGAAAPATRERAVPHDQHLGPEYDGTADAFGDRVAGAEEKVAPHRACAGHGVREDVEREKVMTERDRKVLEVHISPVERALYDAAVRGRTNPNEVVIEAYDLGGMIFAVDEDA